jgi:hypothetical protein
MACDTSYVRIAPERAILFASVAPEVKKYHLEKRLASLPPYGAIPQQPLLLFAPKHGLKKDYHIDW